MSRRVYHVVWRQDRWHVRRVRAQRSSSCHLSKHHAIGRAVSYATVRGGLGQVVIHGKNGSVQREWTYGNDPRSSVG